MAESSVGVVGSPEQQLLHLTAQRIPILVLDSTVNESRRYLGVVAALYFSTMEPRQDLLDRIGHMSVALVVGICVLTVVRWGANAVGLRGGLFGEGGTMRVLPAAATSIIGQAAMLGVPALREQVYARSSPR